MNDKVVGPREMARYRAMDAAARQLQLWMCRPAIATEVHQVPESLRPVLAAIIAAHVTLPMVEK